MPDISELRGWLESEVAAGDSAVQVWADAARSIEEQYEAQSQEIVNWRNEAVSQQERYLETKEQYERARWQLDDLRRQMLQLHDEGNWPITKLIAERDGLKEQLEAAQSDVAAMEELIRYLGEEHLSSQAEAHLRTFWATRPSNPASSLRDDSSPQHTEET